MCSLEISKEVDSLNPFLSRHLNDVREQAVQRPEGGTEQEQVLSPGNAPGMIKEHSEVQCSRSGVKREKETGTTSWRTSQAMARNLAVILIIKGSHYKVLNRGVVYLMNS